VGGEQVYLDFDVLMGSDGPGGYWARVVNAPAGEGSRVTFGRPFTEVELENFLLRIGRPRRVVRRLDAPELAAAKGFGARLYEAAFSGPVDATLLRSLEVARARGAGLRVRLRLSDAPQLAELPWELLYDRARNRFLCLSERTPVVRLLEVPDPVVPVAVAPPLRVLVVICAPSDYPGLAVEEEWSRLAGAVAPLVQAGLVELVRLPTGTLSGLRRSLRREVWHVLHFVGHGGFDPVSRDGVLLFEDEVGRGRRVSGQDLGMLVHGRDLRLVVLNACEGARADPADPFAGVAQSLLQQGVPAVVAMQFEITDAAAVVFAQELYEAVTDGCPIDAAVSAARQAVYLDGNQVEWATPVLHLRGDSGQLFTIHAAQPAHDDASTLNVGTGNRTLAGPPPLVVDQFGRADHTTIAAAIAAARPGDRIMVRPGFYQESLVIDKPVEVIGDGPVSAITVQARGSDVVRFTAPAGRVSNLTLRQAGGAVGRAVNITRGRLVLEGCDLSSHSGVCIAIHGGADPRIRGNRISNGKNAGVYVYGSGLGTVEDNDITGNTRAGVWIGSGGNPTVRGNRISNGKAVGVYVYVSGLGTIEDNDITGNVKSGIVILSGRNPTVRGNRINRNGGWGIRISLLGGGTVERNDLSANKLGALHIGIGSRSKVTQRDNTE